MRRLRPELYFVTILLSIDKIKRNIQNVSYEKFIEDERLFGTEPEIIFAKAYLLQAIELTIPIYKKMNRDESVAYLEMVLDRLR